MAGVRLLLKSMSKVKFPKRETDGSFCVEITILVETNKPEMLSQRFQSWASQWVEENQIWMREWSSGKKEQLHYSREFKREPYPVSCSPTQLKIRLEGQPTAKWWKDWMVLRILNDLKSSFTEYRDVSSIKDCG